MREPATCTACTPYFGPTPCLGLPARPRNYQERQTRAPVTGHARPCGALRCPAMPCSRLVEGPLSLRSALPDPPSDWSAWSLSAQNPPRLLVYWPPPVLDKSRRYLRRLYLAPCCTNGSIFAFTMSCRASFPIHSLESGSVMFPASMYSITLQCHVGPCPPSQRRQGFSLSSLSLSRAPVAGQVGVVAVGGYVEGS
jgi:hypothetical protein